MATSRANDPSVIADRGKIIGMWENGTPVLIIAEQTGFAQSTVYRWIARWQTEGSLETRPRSGRPRVLTGEVQEHLVQATKETPFISSVQLTRHLELRCHPRTVRRTLHLNSIHAFVPAVKEKLTQTHKESRLGFALEYLPYDKKFWRSVIFTDEKVFTSVDAASR
ncbi:hypothetical protein Pcinc_018003 [Petrolisthes cinctipes]|uniref:Transposase n=1 Tax=Petrolisthes cinctipes TaxID=88211 RepID=A0AAE1KMX9_PETCI|nr:hypothetical protein Pcinc_018003 [Petrolisthes cinctipes]